LDVALRRALAIEAGAVSVELDGVLASGNRTAIGDEESLDEYVEGSVKENIPDELDD
jgi:hypothetical protein